MTSSFETSCPLLQDVVQAEDWGSLIDRARDYIGIVCIDIQFSAKLDRWTACRNDGSISRIGMPAYPSMTFNASCSSIALCLNIVSQCGIYPDHSSPAAISAGVSRGVPEILPLQ